MADSMSLQMTPETKARLEGLTREMQKMTGAEMSKVVRNVGRDCIRAALRLTPSVKEGFSPIWVNPKLTGGAYVPWHRKSAMGGFRKVDQLHVTPGITKAGWVEALIKTGHIRFTVFDRPLVKDKTTGEEYRVGRISRSSAQVRRWGLCEKQNSGGQMGLVVGNQAPWIEDFDKGKNPQRKPLHIVERAAQRVAATMDKRLTDMAAKMAETWQGFRR
jgi:hypothetical protein